ncbi:MAG TPA: hypothetical protein ENF76_03820 [Candidatus Bathyarchaeota archaeon]|nr:MAG: hypothetical protein DRO50_01290 [Candidatus Bathyarchaeota archaeon]HDI07474.1 hypothetical protein [Candidatus Bathyarchaeota archaeon]
MKFITDGMLGKITRWLRMLGHNVKYSNKLDDAKLVEIARKEKRILLTRDLALYQQATAKGVKAFYLEGVDEAEKLARLSRKFGFELEIDMSVSRCPKCNARVVPVEKEEVSGRVEETTYKYYDKFWKCPKCGQIYWQGAHWKRIRETLEKARKLSETLEKRK